MSFDESFWSDSYTGFSLNSNRTWSTSEVIPTPPRSPSMEPDEILGLEPTFSNVDMVNPNCILDESHHRQSDECPSLSALNLDIPLLEDIDIKLENLDSYLGDEFSLNEPLCQHGFVHSFCNSCFDDSFKTEIVNDCMWTAGTAVQVDKIAMKTSTVLSSSAVTYSRTHHDSTSSRYSDLLDPLAGAIANMDSDLAYSAPRLETPSESSDTDTDIEENHSSAENVHLDHNYHFTNTSSNHKSDITSPLLKALHKVSMAQTDSDDEIDVVNVGAHETKLNNRLPKYHGTVAFRDDVKGEHDISTTVVVGTPAKRGRKPGSTGPRKVGRPSKNVKRINNKGPKPLGRRCSGRSVTMDPHKRSLHNSMERMRRVDLKNCFDAVRCNVPALRERTRAPKVLILKSAAELVKNLEKGELKKRLEVERLRQYQRLLLMKLQRLKEETGIAEKELG